MYSIIWCQLTVPVIEIRLLNMFTKFWKVGSLHPLNLCSLFMPLFELGLILALSPSSLGTSKIGILFAWNTVSSFFFPPSLTFTNHSLRAQLLVSPTRCEGYEVGDIFMLLITSLALGECPLVNTILNEWLKNVHTLWISKSLNGMCMCEL